MKWTSLRLNMLPITAVEVQYACQTLTNLHNALVDAATKQSSPLARNFPIKSVPLFTSAQNFLPITIQKSKIPNNEPQSQKMTYEKLITEYDKIKYSIQQQIVELNKFYVRYSHDSSASLFHMLRLRLQRVLFDCGTEKSLSKKVLTAAEQQKQYKEIAKKFQSKNSKASLTNQPKLNPDTKFLESWDTFKTQNYPGYENDSFEVSKNQFFQLDKNNYQKLNFDLKPSNYISQNNLKPKSKSKPKNSPSPSPQNNHQKPTPSKSPTSKTLIKKDPTSQLTIATERDNEKNRLPVKQQKKNLNHIQNDLKSYKNLKVLTTSNVPSKTTKKQIQAKIPKQTFSNTYSNNKNTANKKITETNEKKNGYIALNQKKDEMKKKNVSENPGQKQTLVTKNQTVQKQEKKQKSPSKTPDKTSNLSPKKGVNEELSKTKVEPKKPSPLKQPRKQEKKEEKEMNDLKQMLISSGSELRFTIKMSREEYKSLLEFKSKMNKQKV